EVTRAGRVPQRGGPPPPPRASDRPTCVYVETETAGPVPGAPAAQAWWDVPVAQTATRPAAVKARETYDRQAAARRRHL
ncbi:3D-(3,5/4)-trihydroxycyclohexane-1,2-dione acylhydrolase (decyclizing), partial [Streptomyces sp. NPDC000941]